MLEKYCSRAMFLVLTLVLSACGGGSGSTSDGGEGGSSGSGSSSSSSSSGGSSSSSSSSGSSGGGSSSSSSSGAGDTFVKAYQLSDDQLLEGRPLLALPDGGLIYVAHSDDSDVIISRLDAHGAPMWTRYIDSLDVGVFYSEAWVHGSSELYIVGQARNENIPNLGAGRLVLDIDTGELKSSNYLKLAGIQTFDFDVLDENNDGDIDAVVLVTRAHPDKDYFIVKADINLNVIWANEITALDALAGAITGAPDGSVFMATEIKHPSDYTKDKLYLIKFDRDGNLLFQKSLDFGADFPAIDIYTVHAIPSESAESGYQLTLSGFVDIDSASVAEPRAWYMGMDASGNVLWSERMVPQIPLLIYGKKRNGELLLARHTDTHAYYGTLSSDGAFSSMFSVENELDIDIDSALEMADGGIALKIATNRFDDKFVDILAKINKDNNLPKLAEGLVAVSTTIETVSLTASLIDETFSAASWALDEPVESEPINYEVDLTVTDLAIK